MENILGLDATTALVLTGLVMGGVELVKRLFKKDWQATIIIIVASIIGGLAGLAFGIHILQGIVYGLAASGYVTLAQNIGKSSHDYTENSVE